MTLKPVADRLGELMKKPVTFVKACVGPEAEAACADPAPGSIIVLENLRWHLEEEGKIKNKEGEAFAQVLDADKVQRPLTAIVGGAKIKDKILVLENLIDQSDRIMCIGGMAYTFLKVSQDMAIGSSLFDK